MPSQNNMTTLTVKHKPYPVYKPSGVEWLSDVPAHWEVAAAKRHFSIQLGKMLRNTPNGPADAEVSYLKAQHVQWFQVVTANIPTMWANQYETIKFGIQQGDLLVCEGGEGGRCAILHQQIDNCIIQNALHRVRSRGQSLNAFLLYVMSTVNAVGWFDVLNEKATIAHFTKEKFDALLIPSPPLAEQRAIAAFLDRETAKFDALVSKKERLIELLQEKRTALISHTVAKGLDPNAPMKPSGVEWLGEVPVHWEVKRLKHLGELQGGAGFPHEEQWDTTQEYPFFKVGDMGAEANQREMIEYQHTVSPDTARRLGAYKLPPSTIVFAKVGAALMLNRRRMIVRPSCIDNNMMGFIPRVPDPDWMLYWLSGLDFRKLANPGAVPSVNEGQIREQETILPPLAEQCAIVSFLDQETAKLDNLIAKVHRVIELLEELRTSLISAAVTGKIDIREEA